ncbi:MAG: uroporphyrinogen decarboxylase family protein [Halanaerobiaceae bacterium]
MRGKELFNLMNQGKMPPRIPFIPTIYEHAARIINKTPSQIARNEDLLVKAQLAGYETYQPDLVSTGVDIYNVEAEAMGVEVKYPDNEEIPSLTGNLIQEKADLGKLKIPDPETDARMPLFLKAVERINRGIGNEVMVNGTVTGPFTLAAILRGFENFITDILTDPEFASKIMELTAKVSLKYSSAFLKRGVGVSVNESWISPPLLSPDLFRKYVFEKEKEIIRKIRAQGTDNVALISGGNTTVIAPCLVKTGSSLLLADYNTDQEYFKNLCAEHGIFLRASIESRVVEKGSKTEIQKQVSEVINTCSDYHKFILGCGVVSYDTPVERILELKNMVEKFSSDR